MYCLWSYEHGITVILQALVSIQRVFTGIFASPLKTHPMIRMRDQAMAIEYSIPSQIRIAFCITFRPHDDITIQEPDTEACVGVTTASETLLTSEASKKFLLAKNGHRKPM